MANGTALENTPAMIKKFTYKELTLLLGILVALIIVFAFWMRQPWGKNAAFGIKPPSVTETIKNAAVKTYVNVAEELL